MDNETLKYLEQRFDSISQKQDKVNDLLFEKLNAIHEQTIRTNGRVNKHDEQVEKLNTLHDNCAGKKALESILVEKKEKETKETKEYRIGELLLNVSIVTGIVIGIMALMGKMK